MDRLLRGVKREKPGSIQRNRRSGRNDELLKAIECKSGELVMGTSGERPLELQGKDPWKSENLLTLLRYF